MASSNDPFVTSPKSNQPSEQKRRQDRKRRWVAEQEKRTRERIDRELSNL